MFMQKIEAPAVTCNLFDTVKGWQGAGSSSNAPRGAGEDEARAYANFLRRKNNAPDLGKPAMHTETIGKGRSAHFYYVGATYGAQLAKLEWCSETRSYTGGEYEAGSFSVLFPGANMMRQGVTLESLDDAGEVISSQTMPIEPKKGGVVWARDDVRAIAGKLAKPKVARQPRKATPTASQAAPTMDKRRRAVMMALRLRKQLRISRDIAHDRLCQLAENARQNAAKRTARPDAPATAPDAILSDLAAAERLMRGAGYVPAAPLSMRDDFRALYRIARRDKLAGEALYRAALEVSGEAKEQYTPKTSALYTAVARALETPEALRYRLQRNVLNGWGSRHGLRSPAMTSPRFEAWRRVSAQATALRNRLADAGRLEFDAGNWVAAVLPLPVTPEPTPTPVQTKRSQAHERAIRRAWSERKVARAAMAAYNASGDDRRALHKESEDWQGRAQRLETQLQGKRELLDAMHENYAALGDYLDRVATKRRRAVLNARDLQTRLYAEHRLVDRANDRRRLAEQIAEDHMRMREELQRILADAEQRLAAAEAENAQLWAEIEALTAPQPALAA